MNSQQIQINHRWVTSLLLAGLVLVATAGLAWIDASISQAKGEAGSETVDVVEYDSGYSAVPHRRSVKAGKMGGAAGGLE